MFNPTAKKQLVSYRCRLLVATFLFVCASAAHAESLTNPPDVTGGADFARLHGSTRSDYDKLRQTSERIEALRLEVAQVRQLKASISVRYPGLPESAFSPQDQQALADLQKRERTLKDRHNALATQYNQWMVKTKHRFNTPQGLPQGIKQVLPRHYIPLTDVVIF